MSAEENKALIRRFNEEAFNGHSVEARARFLGPNFAINGRIVDPARSRQNFASLFTAFPDFHRTKEDTVAEGDKVVARYTATGTHQGEYMGVPATGKKVSFSWITIYRIADGKVAEEWLLFDQLGLLQQLGAVKPLQ
jgi:C-1 hydroxylase